MRHNKRQGSRFRAALRRLGKRVTSTISAVRTFLTRQEEGASLTEYALLIGLLVLVCLAGMAALSGFMNTVFTNLASKFTSGG